MILNTDKINEIFIQAIKDYHIIDDVNQTFNNKYSDNNSFEVLLYKKCWIDTVQWHYEDLIRDPEINPNAAIELKRKIDASNQQRTDLVELIDDYILDSIKSVQISDSARINTESPGWALDRLSILNLKVYHWEEETQRTDATEEHTKKALEKLKILKTQYSFLNQAIDFLFEDMNKGLVIAQTFKQMKMYNDEETNPILRKLKNK